MTRRLDLAREPTPAEIRRAREDYQEGVPLQELARRMGRSEKYVNGLLADLRAAKREQQKKHPRPSYVSASELKRRIRDIRKAQKTAVDTAGDEASVEGRQ